MTAQFASWGEEDLLPLDAQTFYQTAADLQVIRSIVEKAGASGTDLSNLLTDDDNESIKHLVGKLAAEIGNFGCKVTLASAQRIIGGADSGVLTYQGLVALVNEIDGRLRDELAGRVSFSLNDFEASYFHLQRPLLGDPNYELRFPSLVYDLEEAGKCFALDRYTAAVFHMVRALEMALLSICRCAGVAEPVRPIDRTWGALVGKLEDEMKAKWPHAADRMKGDGLFFEDLYVTMDALKNPIRNATAHPHQRFDMVGAYDVFRNGATLLRKINQRCDERGVPKVRKR